jgi:hypothetical protein
MVAAATNSIDQKNVEWKHEPQSIDAFPHNGSKVGVTVGMAGEWMEISEWNNQIEKEYAESRHPSGNNCNRWGPENQSPK